MGTLRTNGRRRLREDSGLWERWHRVLRSRQEEATLCTAQTRKEYLGFTFPFEGMFIGRAEAKVEIKLETAK